MQIENSKLILVLIAILILGVGSVASGQDNNTRRLDMLRELEMQKARMEEQRAKMEAIRAEQVQLEMVALSHAMIAELSTTGNNSLNLLNDKNVHRDLELIDDQVKEIDGIRKKYRARFKEAVKSMQESKSKDVSVQFKKIKKEQEQELANVLLPHQQERIKQIQYQLQLKSRGTLGVLVSGPIGKELEITPDQVKKLTEFEKTLQKETAKKIEQIKMEARKRLLKQLTPEQQLKFKKLTGDEFINSPK